MSSTVPWWLRSLARLPLGLLYALAAPPRLILRHLLRQRVAVARSNLKRCFPERSDRELTAILDRHYRNLGEVLAECCKLASLPAAELRRHVHIANLGLLQAEFTAGRSVMLCAAHLCNWEWQLQAVVAHLEVPVDAAYKPLHSKRADQALLRLRARLGARLVAAKKLVRAVARHRDELRVIALMADQAPSSSGGRHWVPFFGQRTAFYPGPAEIARMTGYAAFFTAMRRLRRGYYEMSFHPLTAAGERLDPPTFTARYAALLERHIRAEPANWLWAHRRWKGAAAADAAQ